jgi:hypothetical protein
MVPWLAGIAIAGVMIVALDGVERAAGVGALIATIAGAFIAVTQSRIMVRSMRTWLRDRESTLSTFADDRAAAVARQFQWAVDELVNVRAELRRTDGLRVEAEQLATRLTEEAGGHAEELRIARERLAELDGSTIEALHQQLDRTRESLQDKERERNSAERRARLAEQRAAEVSRTLRVVLSTVGQQEPPVLVDEATPTLLEWTLEYDGSSHALRLRSAQRDLRPDRARIVDATGRTLAESPSTMLPHTGPIVMRIPHSVAAAVESGDWSAFQLEAEIDGAWRLAALVERGMAETEDRPQRVTALRIVS